MSQLILDFYVDRALTFDNFVVGDNQDLVAFLQRLVDGDDGQSYAYVWGSIGSGCSHLLQACCHLAESKQLSSVMIDLRERLNLGSRVLDNLENLDLIVLDNIEAIQGDAVWEEGVFHLYNRILSDGFASQKTSRLLIAGTLPPTQLECGLADLQSRLTHGIVYKVEPLSDEHKVQALTRKASDLGLLLPKEVIEYLFSHRSRHLNDLLVILDQLDRASWVAKRKLTIPFVKSVLEGCEHC